MLKNELQKILAFFSTAESEREREAVEAEMTPAGRGWKPLDDLTKAWFQGALTDRADGFSVLTPPRDEQRTSRENRALRRVGVVMVWAGIACLVVTVWILWWPG